MWSWNVVPEHQAFCLLSTALSLGCDRRAVAPLLVFRQSALRTQDGCQNMSLTLPCSENVTENIYNHYIRELQLFWEDKIKQNLLFLVAVETSSNRITQWDCENSHEHIVSSTIRSLHQTRPYLCLWILPHFNAHFIWSCQAPRCKTFSLSLKVGTQFCWKIT